MGVLLCCWFLLGLDAGIIFVFVTIFDPVLSQKEVIPHLVAPLKGSMLVSLLQFTNFYVIETKTC